MNTHRLVNWLLVNVCALTMTSTSLLAETNDESKLPRGNQLVRVVTISQDGLREEPGRPLLDATMTRLNRAASFEPDIACLPETFTRGEAETVPGPTTNRLSVWAKKHACYVICPITVRSGERISLRPKPGAGSIVSLW